MKHLIVLMLLLSSLTAVWAQEESTEEAQTDYDATDTYDYENQEETTHTLIDPQELNTTDAYKARDIEVKKFDPDKWKKVVGSETYREKDVPQQIQKPRQPWNGEIFRVFSYIVIIILVLLILYYVTKNITFQPKFRKVNAASHTDEMPVDNIEDTDLQGLLQQALQTGDFRKAVRLYYLLLLKQLNAREIIEWKKDKTNREYLAELFARDYHYDEAKHLTLAYERVWYGEYILEPESFRVLIARFENFYNKINVPVTP